MTPETHTAPGAGPGATGKVYLVGAGPGDPELITVRGLRCIRLADVLIHDRLVHPALVDEAPTDAERVFAGKAPGFEALPQDAINELMIRRAGEGKAVARLKGGDPFVFGRGGEEALALARAGVDFEIVSGPSSAVTVPTQARIPLTHRELASSFAVITGHRAGRDHDAGIDWRALATFDTLVVLMGVGNLESIVASLIAHGRPPETPASLVEQGTLAEERILSAPLAELPELAHRRRLSPPAVLVVGEVAGLGELLRQARPLAGRQEAAASTAAERPGAGPDAAEPVAGEAAGEVVSGR